MTAVRPTVRHLAALLAVLAVTGPLTGLAVAGTGVTAQAAGVGADVDAGTVVEGNVATIDVRLPDGTDTATVSVGDRDDGFLANATLHDRDGDGTVTVALDTAGAGNGNASSYLSARGADELTGATQVTGAVDGGLDPLPYGVDLVHDGDVVAEGTLFVDADETAGNESATAAFDHEGDRLTLAAADGQTVRGETSLAPGSDVTVVLEASREGSVEGARWVESFSDATVAANGTFAASFDLAGYGPNVTFQARFVHEETVLATTVGRLAPCERDCLRTDEVRAMDSVEVDQNRTAEIPVTFGDADRLNVTVTNTTGPAYRLDATVRDTDGDDRATLLVRTGNVGTDDPTLFVREGDETRPAEASREATANDTLPAALYDVTVGTPGQSDDWDASTFVVFESRRSPVTVTATPGAPTDDAATDTPETPDPLDVETDGGRDGFGLLPLGSVGAGGLIAIGGLLRLLRR